MKISEMITEEMVREIVPEKLPLEDFMAIIGEEYIRLYPCCATEIWSKSYDLARFLFIDAWDYFINKKWDIMMSSNWVEVLMFDGSRDTPKYHKNCMFDDYPSRLHAMAAAVQYMWEQEK